jgi:endo-1,4-beta-D-glucanase Y
MNNKIIGVFLMVVAVVISLTVIYRNSQKRQETLVYSTTYTLNALWASYKKDYVENATGRTVDPQRDNITTSEGQSYTMLRAVWQDDKPTFDSSWNWAKANLKRPEDNLTAWLYGQRSDGTYGVLNGQGGQNSASDADADIALALVLASSRWQEPAYLEEAKKIISDIWDKEVVAVNGTPYLAANNLEKTTGSEILINPSYLAPYAYRIFAEIDPQHDWNKVVDSSYHVISQSAQLPLDKKVSAGLPPDWVAVDKNTGGIKASAQTALKTNYGYDAMRTAFRLALDYQWNGDARAREVLGQFSFLREEWEKNRRLFATYAHDGSVVSEMEAPAMYGGSLGYFLISDPKNSEAVYKEKLLNLYNPDYQNWKQPLSYYDSNWAWFGIALYNNRLTNFYKN